MDFTRLQSIQFDQSNATLSSLPSTLLDALLPGYGFISQIVFRILGFDIGLVVSGCLVVYALGTAATFLYRKIYGLFSSYFISTIQIDDDDKMFSRILRWISEQNMTKVSRDLKAVTNWVTAWDESDEEVKAADEEFLDESGIFNFEKWASNIPPRYEPNLGTNRFWHKSRMFTFSRTQRPKQTQNYWGNPEHQIVQISCIGRKTEPIKELLDHIKRWSLAKENRVTAINRPASKEVRMQQDYAWDTLTKRPCRPMATVSLDMEQKARVVADVNEYLQPASARWYASRGIPYRRGFLFHGPPGTGKTSLSFALAGIFGLDIYCISLMDADLTESDLAKLFSELPRRCIVLLEDVDAAGLHRPDEAFETKSKTKTDGEEGDGGDSTVSSEDELTKISSPNGPSRPKGPLLPTAGGFKSLISLSGLLNVIDGVASHEGRVLILTTNCPEKLDAALIRPGRVDMQIKFTLATRAQMRDIFRRMYSTDRDQEPAPTNTAPKKPSAASPSSSPIPPSPKTSASAYGEDDDFLALLSRAPVVDAVDPAQLRAMADEFADQLPEHRFSPAEIQGFLLMRKKEPRRALDEVGRWRDGVLEARAKDSRVLEVQ